MKINKNKFNGEFSLKNTILSDQCPSDTWERNEKYGSYILGFDKKFHKIVAWEDKKYLYYNSDKKLEKELLYLFWADYPLNDFYKKFRRDKYISRTIKSCKGLRPMRDLDINYRIIESIITQNNNLKRIRKLDRELRKLYGNGLTYNISKLSKAKLNDLKRIGLGYRAEYILNISKKLKNKEIDIEKLKEMKTEEARKFLMKIKGIGPKVADIILGFGLGKRDVFPADVWLKRAIKREYFKKEVSNSKLRKFALEYFGEHAQVAHVYIYCYERRRENG